MAFADTLGRKMNSAEDSSAKNPEEALEMLMAGNQRYVSGRLSSYRHNLAQLRRDTAEKQKPFATVLACADSRVPVELIFDRSIGHLFVVRVAGNIVTPDVMASIEYGAAVLGTKIILVLGHSGCGAVKATLEGKSVPGQISSLFPYMQPAVDQAGGDFDSAVRLNAQFQADLVRKASPLLGGLISEKKLKVGTAIYNLSSGKVSLV